MLLSGKPARNNTHFHIPRISYCRAPCNPPDRDTLSNLEALKSRCLGCKPAVQKSSGMGLALLERQAHTYD